MIIASDYPLNIGQKYTGLVTDVTMTDVLATFIVLEQVTLEDLWIQIDELCCDRNDFTPFDHYTYWKVQVD